MRGRNKNNNVMLMSIYRLSKTQTFSDLKKRTVKLSIAKIWPLVLKKIKLLEFKKDCQVNND